MDVRLEPTGAKRRQRALPAGETSDFYQVYNKPFSLLTFLKESKQRTFVQNFVLPLCVGVEQLL